jgi:hypothetical protein
MADDDAMTARSSRHHDLQSTTAGRPKTADQ